VATLPPTAHPGQEGLTLEQAGRALGLSPRTVRRMVRRGELAADKIEGPHGPQYLVRLPAGQAGTVATNGHGGRGQGAPAGQPTAAVHRGQASLVPLVTELTHRVAALEQERFELAGRLGFYQAQLQQAQETIKALQAPQEPIAPPPPAGALFRPLPADPAPPRRPWWRFW